ncbi:MAG TPA: hypothetical protein DDY86_03610 [Syntrophaceae bacterium]|nr:hypothetical protein [Syntrophaceae bacterium]
MATRKQIDWVAAEREYRAGQLSDREIGAQFGCSHTAIQKRAKKYGWKKDLTQAVKKAVARKIVAKVANLHAEATDEEVVDVVAERGAEVHENHRKDHRQSQTIVKRLQEQLFDAINNRDEIKETIIDETKDEEGGADQKRRNAMLKAVSIPTHITCIKDLSIAQRNLTTTERQLFNLNGLIDDDSPDTIVITVKRNRTDEEKES